MKIFFVFFLVNLADLSLQAEWSYDYETQWPGICRTGEQQSPINIMSQTALLDEDHNHIKGPLEFRGYQNVKLSGENNGHTLKWHPDDSDLQPVLSGGPLSGNYTFAQFHLHWLSEHAIDGMKYPLEIHMVHVKSGLTVEQALERPDGIAVVGTFGLVSAGSYAGPALEQIEAEVALLTERTQDNTRVSELDLTRMMSPDLQSYYTYQGSLTTPMCQEAVTWIVMDKPIYITHAQYKALYNVNVGSSYNYRSLQPAGNRVVYRSGAACNAIFLPTFAGTILSLLGCLSSVLASGVNKGVCALMKAKKKFFGDSTYAKQCSKLL